MPENNPNESNETSAENRPQPTDTPVNEVEFAEVPMEDVARGDHAETMDPIADLKQQLADAEKRVLMAHADMENYRKRARRDMQDQVRYASLPLMSELLESVDNLARALESYQQEANGDALAEGVKMVADQISRTLENHGCKKIEAVGEAFDPNLHQAMQTQPSDDYPANTVMMDLRSGFQLYERVIRPSQVFVSTGSTDSTSDNG
ncbi:MAG: nucleotide exchange factor GrpE [Planctomycetota bacterium]